VGVRLGFRLAPHLGATVPLRGRRGPARQGQTGMSWAIGGAVAIVFMAAGFPLYVAILVAWATSFAIRKFV
jgi:hypothetical protein